MRRRKQRPLFLIDIAVPRDLDPAINDLDNVYLYNIDDLNEVVEVNWQRRRHEATKAERLVAAETLKFLHWLETLEVYPTIIAMKDKAEAICRAELKKTLNQLGPLTPEQRQALEVLTDSVTQKLLHDPIIFLKRNRRPRNPHQELDLVRRLFNLDPDRNHDASRTGIAPRGTWARQPPNRPATHCRALAKKSCDQPDELSGVGRTMCPPSIEGVPAGLRKLMVAQVFNLCSRRRPTFPWWHRLPAGEPAEDHRSAGGDACATKGLTSEFGMGSGVAPFLFLPSIFQRPLGEVEYQWWSSGPRLQREPRCSTGLRPRF